jgi:hypothetical protein
MYIAFLLSEGATRSTEVREERDPNTEGGNTIFPMLHEDPDRTSIAVE